MMIEIKRRGRPTRWTDKDYQRPLRMSAADRQTLETAWKRAADANKNLTFNDWIVSSARTVAQRTIERVNV